MCRKQDRYQTGLHKQDNERYETFNEALEIHDFLLKGYEKYGYHVIEVPFGSLESRMKYIFNQLRKL